MPSLVEWAILAWVAGKTRSISYSIYHSIKPYFSKKHSVIDMFGASEFEIKEKSYLFL